MIQPPIPAMESHRLDNLLSYGILDTPTEKEYDEITALASQICGTPISLISLIDDSRQWFKSHHGLAARETPKEIAFCAHAINNQDEVLIIPDSRLDERFHDNPLATDDPHVIFYAGVPLVTPKGFPLGTLCVIDNIPRKLNQEQIEALKLLANQLMKLFELRLSLKELNKSKKELQSLNITKDKLFSIISHDLRGPIGGLKSFVQLLISTRDLTDVKTILKDLKAIQANAASTFDLLENLLAWSISQQNHIKCTPVSIDLYERVDSIINLFTGLSQTKDIRIINAIEKGMLIHADKDMISTIIRNLLSNAIKFTPNGKKITIGCEVNEKGVCVYITDEGKGLDDLHLKRLFRKSDYFTTYGTNGEKGSGLGLLLCKDFIEKHNGEIGVKTKVGKGSTFHFSIPQ